MLKLVHCGRPGRVLAKSWPPKLAPDVLPTWPPMCPRVFSMQLPPLVPLLVVPDVPPDLAPDVLPTWPPTCPRRFSI